jgi:hypothetical protein
MHRGLTKGWKAISRADLQAFITRHREAIRLAYKPLWKDGRIPNVSHADIVAVLARAFLPCPARRHRERRRISCRWESRF